MHKTFFPIIAVAVLLVAAALLFAPVAPVEGHISKSDVDILAQQIVRGEDHVTVEELADRIIKAREDYLLIDLRQKADYDRRHIDTAVHIPLAELIRPEQLDALPEDRAVIVYASDTSQAAQAAVILRLSGIPAYSLDGGYQRWTAYMTDPGAAGIEDASALAKYHAIRCYLEGDYVADAGLVVKQPETAGFTPPLTPVKEEPAPTGDPLGLGLGLGLSAPEPEPGPAVPQAIPVADPLGLGLGLGDAVAPASPPDAGAGLGLGGGAPAGLKIGEGC